MLLVLAFVIGVVSGLRSMTAPAAVCWAARWGKLPLEGTWLAFLGYHWTPWIFTAAAAGELVTDKLPGTPSRKVPVQFIGRIMSGALCGAAIGVAFGSILGGAALGAVGAVAGTLGGAAARSGLVKATGGRDFPIALLEDAIAVGAAILVVRFL
jgi:uncharacterized membrane protein